MFMHSTILGNAMTQYVVVCRPVTFFSANEKVEASSSTTLHLPSFVPVFRPEGKFPTSLHY